VYTFLRDIRFGARSLRKSPALSVVAVLALTLGIGLTTTMFSIVYSALLKEPPFPNGNRIVFLERNNPERGINRSDLPIQDFADYRAQQKSFVDLGAFTNGTMNVSGAEKAERFDGGWVTASVFRILGVQAILGRTFRDGEDAPNTPILAVLAHDMWRDRYAGDPSVIGKSIRVNGQPATIIGVMPDGFVFPSRQKIWLNLQTDPLASKRGEGQHVGTIGLLKPGVTVDRAAVDVSTIAKRLAGQFEPNKGFDGAVRSYNEWAVSDEPRRLLVTMLGAVFCVLLIACVNVANLLLNRVAHRTREVGIRTALGASRSAIVRQFLAEALVLSLVGVALGIALAYGGIAAFARAIVDTDVPSNVTFGLYPPVLAFSIAVGLLATLISGAIPARQSARTDVSSVLKDESRGASGMRIGKISRGLVMFEIALSCALLVAAGLMIKSVTKMRTMDPGFTTRDVFTARIGFPVAYTDTAQQKLFFEQLEQRLATIPGVRAASLSSGLPGAQQGLNGFNFALEGTSYAKDTDYRETRAASVTPGFFSTLAIPLVSGRLFTDADRSGALPVAVVNQRFVEKYLKGQDPVGRRVRFGRSESTEPWMTIIGVVPNVLDAENREDPRPAIVFRPLAQTFASFVYISARANGPPLALTTPIRDVVGALNSDIPLYWVMPLDQAISRQLWFVRVFGTMFMIFGVVALFLAAVGLYAVMSFSVSRRAREVGIRMALGARAPMVVRMILGQGLAQLAVGMTVGLGLALLISKGLSMILFDVQPRDPIVFGGVAVTLLSIGLLACLVPAMRATRVDPLSALRAE
jgi:putative ABC transport system permease protein